MDMWQGIVIAGALATLWSFEAIMPALEGGVGVRGRVRHLLLGLVNGAGAFVVALLLVGADAMAHERGWGLLRQSDLPWWGGLAVALVLLDLGQYAFHVLAHHVPVLWRMHAVHHNADRLEATVALRFHVLEVMLHGLLLIPLAVLLGVSSIHVTLYNLVLVPASLFHHANIRLDPRVDRLLRVVIVTPRMHWLHHSRWQPETNSNYSAVLSVWDRLFGTMRSRRRAETVCVGLDGYGPEEIETLRGIMATPFSKAKSLYGDAPPAEDLEPDLPLIGGERPARGDSERGTLAVVGARPSV